ncbi:MAG: hypothetical protein ACRC1Z_12695 [Waterburya sp.]
MTSESGFIGLNPLNKPSRSDFIYRLLNGQYRYNDLENPEMFLVEHRNSLFNVWCDGLICSLVKRSENLRVKKGFEMIVSPIAASVDSA